MGISRNKWHKKRKTGARQHPIRMKRKFELGRQPANTKLGERRVHTVRCRGGFMKFRAIKLDHGNYCWPGEAVTRKTRILAVVYNATSNELVRTNTLVKGCIIQIDATPFKNWYKRHYGVVIGKPRQVGAKRTAAKGGKDQGKSTKKAKTEEPKSKKVQPKAEGKKVEGKKTEGKKPEVKKVEGKKVEGKKVEGKKVEGKKVEGKKTEGKKAEGKKDESKKKAEGKKEVAKKAVGKTGKKDMQVEKKETKDVKKSTKPKKKRRNPPSKLRLKKWKLRNKTRVLETVLAEQFNRGRLYAKVSSRPGQVGAADGYVLEGDELAFYIKKLNLKKKK